MRRRKGTDRKATGTELGTFQKRENGLPVLQHFLNLTGGPVLAHGNHADAALVRAVHQHMRRHPVTALLEMQIGFRLPAQRGGEIAWKDLPLRSVIEFDDMAFRMRTYLH